MSRKALGVSLLAVGVLTIAEAVHAGGTIIESKIGDKRVKMVLTGSAVRIKRIVKVYNIESYMAEGLKIRTGEELAAADQPKQLHLTFLRTVGGAEMADAFVSLLRANHPEPAFAEEVEALAQLLRKHTVRKGDHVWLTHVPEVGLHCQVVGGTEHLIKGVEFSKAVWGNYFGKYNAGENVKRGLVALLPR